MGDRPLESGYGAVSRKFLEERHGKPLEEVVNDVVLSGKHKLVLVADHLGLDLSKITAPGSVKRVQIVTQDEAVTLINLEVGDA